MCSTLTAAGTAFASIIQELLCFPRAVVTVAYVGDQEEHVARLLLHASPPLQVGGESPRPTIVITYHALEVNESLERRGYGRCLVAAAQSCIRRAFLIPIIEIVMSSNTEQVRNFWESKPMCGRALKDVAKVAARVGAVVGPAAAFKEQQGCTWMLLSTATSAKALRRLTMLGLGAASAMHELQSQEADEADEATVAEGVEAKAAELDVLRVTLVDGSTRDFFKGYDHTLPIFWEKEIEIGEPINNSLPLRVCARNPTSVLETAPSPAP